jgi:DNA-binding NarL/FixJ family response regulator
MENTVKFTNREIDIIRLVTEDLKNREIAARLSIRVDTVKDHLSNIYAKMGVSNRTEAAAYWQAIDE